MKAQYDDFAEQVPLAERLIFRPYVEQYSFFLILGSVAGKSVLDLACGDGFYSRQLAVKGAARVIGVDISSELIKHAKELESEQHFGIDYLVGDAAELPVLGEFDLVVAAYLFHYAESRSQLASMCKHVYENLKSGGRLVTIVVGPIYDINGPNSTKYGITMIFPEPFSEGSKMDAEVLVDPPFTLHAYHWSKETYEEVLQEAGFRNVKWHRPVCSPEGIARYGEGFWNDYLTNPHAVILECER